MAHTLCMNGAQESMPEIARFPHELVVKEEGADSRRWIKGLDTALQRCFDQGKLPSEIGLPWARAGVEVDLRNYHAFPADAAIGARAS
jgi:hypothetical protein